MGKLNSEQRNILREFLEAQGLSFKPLRDEMMDHLSCDVEDRMMSGISFEEAWVQSVGDIPDHHFQNIQQQIMETINNRFGWSQGFSFVALALLLISTIFKVLHLQFAGELLLLSFAFIAAALLTTSLSGIFLNNGKKGAARVLGLILGLIFMLFGFSFKILHLTGADQLIVLAVTVLIIALLANSFYVYRYASGQGNLLTYLHEKYTPGIERFFLLLLIPLTVYKLLTLWFDSEAYVGNMVLLVIILGGGLQFIALCWRTMEKDLSKRNTLTLMAIVICCISLVLVFLGPLLTFEIRVAMIIVFNIVAAWLSYRMEEEPKRSVSLIMACLVPVLFLGWALIRLNLIPSSYSWMFFNIPLMVILVAGVFISRKHGTLRTFLIVSVSGYLFDYLA